jgi:NADPH:quinone reductase-like Zn-dependent oxidoreductase
VKAGETVLINGAGGGTGTLAIPLAKSLGADVTGVDNGHKQALMKQVGADHVIDYTQTDFTAKTVLEKLRANAIRAAV